MEFFRIAEVAEQSIAISLGPEYWRFAMIYAGVAFLVVYVFQTIALYTIASRNGFKRKWMAFIPFLNTYYIGACSQKNKALWFKSNIIGIIAAILEFVLCAGYALHYTGYHFAEDYMKLVDIQLPYLYVSEEIPLPQIQVINWDTIPYELYWAGFCYETLPDILYAGTSVYLFLQVMLLSAFFQTYMPRRYLLLTIFGVVFPIKGILFFAVRNNQGVCYREYVLREQEKRYRMYRQHMQDNIQNQNYYGQGNYGQYNNDRNSYDNGEYSDQNSGSDDPFEEFGNSNDEPFNQ